MVPLYGGHVRCMRKQSSTFQWDSDLPTCKVSTNLYSRDGAGPILLPFFGLDPAPGTAGLLSVVLFLFLLALKEATDSLVHERIRLSFPAVKTFRPSDVATMLVMGESWLNSYIVDTRIKSGFCEKGLQLFRLLRPYLPVQRQTWNMLHVCSPHHRHQFLENVACWSRRQWNDRSGQRANSMTRQGPVVCANSSNTNLTTVLVGDIDSSKRVTSFFLKTHHPPSPPPRYKKPALVARAAQVIELH